MARNRAPLDPNSDRLRASYGRLAKRFEAFGLDTKQANHFALRIQKLTAQRQNGLITNEQFNDKFYFIYDWLYDNLDIDMHDPDFYPKRSS